MLYVVIKQVLINSWLLPQVVSRSLSEQRTNKCEVIKNVTNNWQEFYDDLDPSLDPPNKTFSYDIWTKNYYELVIDTTKLSPRHTTILMDLRNITIYGIYDEDFPSKFFRDYFVLPENMFWGTVGAQYIEGWTIIHGWQLDHNVEPPIGAKRLAYQTGEWEPWVSLNSKYMAEKMGSTIKPAKMKFPKYHSEEYYIDNIEKY